MPEGPQVKDSVEKGVLVLTVDYSPELLLERGASVRLSQELLRHYEDFRDNQKVKTTSCVVDIQAQVAGSPLVRALFDLLQTVFGRAAGQAVVVNYPEEYLQSLTSLGLPALAGFTLAGSKEEALRKVTKLKE